MSQTNQEVSLSELTLTPFTGASLVNEILKGLIYQKCQIPYPYSWLKSVVEKRRKKLDSSTNVAQKVNFTHENHFRTVSATYDALDSIMKGITKEFCDTNSMILEVVCVFGSTPVCPKEVFTISLPSTIKGHNERNHISQLNTNLQKVLRNIFLSQSWMDSIDASVSCTNTFIYLKKQTSGESLVSEAFQMCEPLKIGLSTKHSKCTISYEHNLSERTNCCDSLLIFNENGDDIEQQLEVLAINVEEQVVWCRSKDLIKGFKDCFVNKVSVCELW